MWPDPPNDEDPTQIGQIFEHICKEWETQVIAIKKGATVEAEEADKTDDVAANKDDGKPVTSRPK